MDSHLYFSAEIASWHTGSMPGNFKGGSALQSISAVLPSKLGENYGENSTCNFSLGPGELMNFYFWILLPGPHLLKELERIRK